MRPRPATAVSTVLLLATAPAWAQQPPDPPPAPPAEAPAPPASPEPAPPVPPAVGQPETGPQKTDHDTVVRRWGIEARRVATVQRTPKQDLACKDDCPLTLNALALRRWSTSRYAWSLGLALGFGGGSSRTADTKYSWDTYLGLGPTLGATFLLANWQHLAVGLSPQIDFVFFMPGGTRPKSVILDLRGLVEGEVHLGMIGLPQVSLGLASGLAVHYRGVSDAAKTPTGTSGEWSVGLAGPQTLWGLVTNMFLRFYL